MHGNSLHFSAPVKLLVENRIIWVSADLHVYSEAFSSVERIFRYSEAKLCVATSSAARQCLPVTARQCSSELFSATVTSLRCSSCVEVLPVFPVCRGLSEGLVAAVSSKDEQRGAQTSSNRGSCQAVEMAGNINYPHESSPIHPR